MGDPLLKANQFSEIAKNGSLEEAIKYYELAAQQYLLATNNTTDSESFTNLTNLAQSASQKAADLMKLKQQQSQQQQQQQQSQSQQQQIHHHSKQQQQHSVTTSTNPMTIPSSQRQTNFYPMSTPPSVSSSYSSENSPSRATLTMNMNNLNISGGNNNNNNMNTQNQFQNQNQFVNNPNPSVVHYAVAGSPGNNTAANQAAGFSTTTINTNPNTNFGSNNINNNIMISSATIPNNQSQPIYIRTTSSNAPSSVIKATPPSSNNMNNNNNFANNNNSNMMQESTGPMVGERDFFVGEGKTSVQSSLLGREEIIRMFPPQMRQVSNSMATIGVVDQMRELKEPSSTNNSDILFTPSSGNNNSNSSDDMSPTDFIWNWMEKIVDLLPRLQGGGSNSTPSSHTLNENYYGSNSLEQANLQPTSPSSSNDSSLLQSFYLMNTNKKMSEEDFMAWDKRQLVSQIMKLQQENASLQGLFQRNEKENDVLKRSIANFRSEFQKKVGELQKSAVFPQSSVLASSMVGPVNNFEALNKIKRMEQTIADLQNRNIEQSRQLLQQEKRWRDLQEEARRRRGNSLTDEKK